MLQLEVPKLWTPGRRNDRRVRCAPPPPPPPAGFGVPLQGQNYIVPPIPGLSFWFDARIGVDAPSNNLVQWSDSIGGHIVTASGSSPTWAATTSGLGSFPSVTVGTGARLITTIAASFLLSPPSTVFAIVVSPATLASGAGFIFDGTISSTRQAILSNSGNFTTIPTVGTGPAVATSTAYALALSVSASNVEVLYVNSSSVGTTTGSTTATQLQGLSIGSVFNGPVGTNGWLGPIAVIAGMPVVATAAQVSAFFKSYANLTSNTWS